VISKYTHRHGKEWDVARGYQARGKKVISNRRVLWSGLFRQRKSDRVVLGCFSLVLPQSGLTGEQFTTVAPED
jgi:hypothetical protein